LEVHLAPTSSHRGRTWFVTGCSSGLGRALCERLLERGERVVATARDIAKIAEFGQRFADRAVIQQLDITDHAGVNAAVHAALSLGGVDVLVNNAGYGLVGALEEVDEQAVKDAFDANVYGAYRLIRALLPHMRARKSGHILNVSSMAGFVGGPGFTFYSATKFALEGLSEALAKEVAPFGIKVTLIEPGPFRTNFRGETSMRCAAPMQAYADTVGRFRKMLADTDGKQPGDPLKAADAMMAVVASDNPPLRLPLGDVCMQAMRAKLAAVAQEMDRWAPVSAATSYETVDA
jgi:NAD(P)-dependent dehydrogenase (short-subunit alcohol dehydrogenase family)